LQWSSRIRSAAVSSIECAYFSKCWAITVKQGFVYLIPYLCAWDQILEGKNCKTLIHFGGKSAWATNLRAEKRYFSFPNVHMDRLCTYVSFSWSLAIFSILLLMYQAFLYIVCRTTKSRPQELWITVNIYLQ
jgi:hypothetical protein